MQINPVIWGTGGTCDGLSGAHVTETQRKSCRIMIVNEPGSIVCLHCVTWEWGQQETYPLLNSIFCIMAPTVVRTHAPHWSNDMHTVCIIYNRGLQRTELHEARMAWTAGGCKSEEEQLREAHTVGKSSPKHAKTTREHPEEMTSHGLFFSSVISRYKIQDS